MAAILEKNGPNGKPAVLPDSLTNREVLKCSDRFCETSYTLAYGASENRLEEGAHVVEIMRRKAAALIEEEHPPHSTDTYVWGGPKQGWLNREAAKAAGL